jgi:hypothetical protein
MTIAIKSAPAECSLQIVETETRDALKDGKRTIAYLAIGAETWGPLLAAAPELKASLFQTANALHALFRDVMKQKDFPPQAALEYGRIIGTARKLLERDL